MREEVVKKVKLNIDAFSSYLYIRIDHLMHKVEFEFTGGKAPNIYLFIDFLLKDKDIQYELKRAAKNYHKIEGSIYFEIDEGRSGCKTIILYKTNAQHEWAEQLTLQKRKIFHISSVGSLSSGIPDLYSDELFYILKILDKKMGIRKRKDNNFMYLRYKYKRAEPIEYLI